MTVAAPKSPWTAPVRLDDIPPGGREVVLVADAAIRAVLAREAGVLAVPRLEACFSLQRRGQDAVHVKGHVSGAVEQTCGVTLEPLINEVNETIDLAFSAAASQGSQAEEEVVASSGSSDAPEPLVDGTLDLGALAVEFLLLGVDPFPRKPGVEFSPPQDEPGGSSPFAALAKLKDRRKAEG